MDRRSATLATLTSLSIAALPSTAFADENLFSAALGRYGWWAALPAAFLVGLGTAATPCVYPMVAITVSVFGARNASRGRAMLLSLAFVTGIAALFVPLGLAAGLSGTVVGALAGSPAVAVFEAALMFAMGLSMLGLFDIQLPSGLQTRLASAGGLGVKGAFVIGLATGPIAAPCATAGLVGILDYVFRMRDVVGGGASLLFYSLGLGLPFFLVGAFSLGLPKPGVWMDRIKSVFGLVLFVLGFYYLRGLVPFFSRPQRVIPAHPALYAALVVFGLGLGAVHLSLKSQRKSHALRKVIGVLVASLGAAWLLAYEPTASTVGGAIAWRRDARDAAGQARSQRRPVLMDFGAFWCPDCNKLARETFSSAAVRRESARFIAIKVFPENAAEENDAVLAQRAEYSVRGLPTIIVFNSHGREVLRLTDFVPAERMAALLRAVD